eukprot:m.1323326 g.1323326  ORF g.1323326 m.1323326 type:complete len:301 (+) comp24849_c0_seq2:1684-2586(+)
MVFLQLHRHPRLDPAVCSQFRLVPSDAAAVRRVHSLPGRDHGRQGCGGPRTRARRLHTCDRRAVPDPRRAAEDGECVCVCVAASASNAARHRGSPQVNEDDDPTAQRQHATRRHGNDNRGWRQQCSQQHHSYGIERNPYGQGGATRQPCSAYRCWNRSEAHGCTVGRHFTIARGGTLSTFVWPYGYRFCGIQIEAHPTHHTHTRTESTQPVCTTRKALPLNVQSEVHATPAARIVAQRMCTRQLQGNVAYKTSLQRIVPGECSIPLLLTIHHYEMHLFNGVLTRVALRCQALLALRLTSF